MIKKKTDKNKADGKDIAKPRAVFPVLKGQEMELEITGLGSTGEGVGRFREIAVFVPGALPGEKVPFCQFEPGQGCLTSRFLPAGSPCRASRTRPGG